MESLLVHKLPSFQRASTEKRQAAPSIPPASDAEKAYNRGEGDILDQPATYPVGRNLSRFVPLLGPPSGPLSG